MPGLGDYADQVHAVTQSAANGDTTMVSQNITAQALTLDSIFAEFARRSAKWANIQKQPNVGGWP